MLEWLKDKTIGRIRRWFLRQYLRVVGEMHQERLRQTAKYIPKELREYHEIETLMNNNVTALHNLYKEAIDKKKFPEAFLYFFYEFEINLKHMIISEMMMINISKTLKEKNSEFFSIYSREKIYSIQKIGHISELIKIFCSIYREKIKDDLEGINRERNFIIHNMLKKEMTEEQIKISFEQFFVNAKSYIKNAYSFFISTINERPKNFLGILRKLVEQQAQNNPDRDGLVSK